MRDEIIGALPVEQITEQLQQERQERLKRMGASEAASSEFPSVPPSVVDEDGKSISSSGYVHASQMATSSIEGAPSPRPKRSKAQLWQDMKINSITRALSLLYTLSLLTLLTRIQLNLLGRRTYLSSVVALASPPTGNAGPGISLENKDDDNYDNVYGNDFETNRKYLTFSWWLLHRGSRQIMDRVMAAVTEVFGGVNIREDITLERLANLILEVRKKVEGETDQERRQMRWLSYLLPDQEDELFVIRQSGISDSEGSLSPDGVMVEDPMASRSEELINASLRRLLDETSDLIDSPTFSQILTHVLDAAYSHLIDYRVATEAFKAPGPIPGVPEPRVVELSDTKCKLAHILPVFCKQAHTIAAGSGELETLAGVAAQEALGNEYLSAIDQVHDLEAFAAVIYSSNFEYEVAEGTNPSNLAPNNGQMPHSEAPLDEPESRVDEPKARPNEPEALPETLQPTQPLQQLSPQPTVEDSHVEETEPKPAAEAITNEKDVVVPHDAAPSNAPAAADLATNDKFEAAWAGALTKDNENNMTASDQ